jgi:hypothetical protein
MKFLQLGSPRILWYCSPAIVPTKPIHSTRSDSESMTQCAPHRTPLVGVGDGVVHLALGDTPPVLSLEHVIL